MPHTQPLHWDDFVPGQVWRFGSRRLTAGEIIQFALLYDPMPMHTDPARAAQTPMGQFCASGIHTFAVTQKMVCDHLWRDTLLVAGGRIENFVMRRPVLPGDELSVRVTVTDRSPHRIRADAGWTDFKIETLRGGGQVVLEYQPRVLFERRSVLVSD